MNVEVSGFEMPRPSRNLEVKMLRKVSIEAPTETDVPTAGPLYPGRCIECPEILTETYGNHTRLRCVDCVAADLAGTRLASN